MIPRTYPSTVNSTTGRRQMVAYFLSSVSGLERWKDYIPVKYIDAVVEIEDSYNNNGFIAIDELTNITGKQAWLNYIPVYIDTAATTPWTVNSVGFIPIGTSGEGTTEIVLQYLSITDSEASPDDIFFADNSTDGGNNTGWTFL